MECDKNEEEAQYILDISRPSTSRQNLSTSLTYVDLEDDEAYYAPSTENEQILVNKFLDGELNFTEYIENVQYYNENLDDTDLPSADTTETVSDSPKKTEKLSGSERARRPLKKLPPALKGLMGEANLRFARGDKETAVKICLEIIRQVPTAPEPFMTLASIYDEMGDQEKYLQMSLVAAHLSPTESYEWIHLGDLSEKLGHIKQAASCYTKAVHLDLFNFELHKRRATLFERIGDKKTPIRLLMKMLTFLKPEQGKEILSTAKYIAELCHRENEIAKASSALDVAFEKCPHLITIEFTHLQLELLIQLRRYLRCLELMVKFCGMELTTENNKITECKISHETPMDIIAKLVIVLIHLRADKLYPKFLKCIIDLEPSEAGDLYLDIIDAFIEENYLAEADRLLSILVKCNSYGLPGVWLKHAENLKAMNRLEDSIRAFYKVVEQAPQHVEARMTLGAILIQLGRIDEAISALTQNEDNDYLDVGLLYERCLLLKHHPSRAQELIMVGQILFSRHSMQIRNKDELYSISIIQRYDKKRNAVKQVRKTKKEPEEDCDIPSFKDDSRVPSREEEWELFKFICNVCIKTKAYQAFQRLTFSAQLSTLFHPFKKEINILSVIACHYNKDSRSGYNIIRTLVAKEPNNYRLWHLFNLIVTKSDDARHHRFIMRQLARNCNHPALAILHGNNCLVSGTYKYAMHEYSAAFVKNPSGLGALLLGLTYLQMAAQKFTSKKHHLVVQAMALFTQYKRLRGPEAIQEVHYNLGRGFHHLGLFTQAIFHYRKVLEYSRIGLAKDQPHIFDLSREAAFNLHLIYSQSESYDLAKMYLEEYVQV